MDKINGATIVIALLAGLVLAGIITAILVVPVLPAAKTAQWPYRPILDAVLTSSMDRRIPIDTYPIALAVICACSLIIMLISLIRCVKRQVSG